MRPDQYCLDRVAHSLVRDYSVHKVDVYVHCTLYCIVYFKNNNKTDVLYICIC